MPPLAYVAAVVLVVLSTWRQVRERTVTSSAVCVQWQIQEDFSAAILKQRAICAPGSQAEMYLIVGTMTLDLQQRRWRRLHSGLCQARLQCALRTQSYCWMQMQYDVRGHAHALPGPSTIM
jgi:hypothetical protein